MALDVALRELAVVGGGVGVADEIEDGGAGLGGVEVVGERGGEGVCGFVRLREQLGIFALRPRTVLDALAEGAQALDGEVDSARPSKVKLS